MELDCLASFSDFLFIPVLDHLSASESDTD